jgi:hypothetical protein
MVEKGGLSEELKNAGTEVDQGAWWADEMRFGLIGQVRRRWVPCGYRLVQELQFEHEWEYLNLAVNPLNGELLWDWSTNMKAATIAMVVSGWHHQGVKVIVWDGARGHRGAAYEGVPVARIFQPAYSPELNPAERIFGFLRDKVEGEVYESLAAKRAAIELELKQLATKPEAVKRIAGWEWILDSIADLAT